MFLNIVFMLTCEHAHCNAIIDVCVCVCVCVCSNRGHGLVVEIWCRKLLYVCIYTEMHTENVAKGGKMRFSKS